MSPETALLFICNEPKVAAGWKAWSSGWKVPMNSGGAALGGVVGEGLPPGGAHSIGFGFALFPDPNNAPSSVGKTKPVGLPDSRSAMPSHGYSSPSKAEIKGCAADTALSAVCASPPRVLRASATPIHKTPGDRRRLPSASAARAFRLPARQLASASAAGTAVWLKLADSSDALFNVFVTAPPQLLRLQLKLTAGITDLRAKATREPFRRPGELRAWWLRGATMANLVAGSDVPDHLKHIQGRTIVAGADGDGHHAEFGLVYEAEFAIGRDTKECPGGCRLCELNVASAWKTSEPAPLAEGDDGRDINATVFAAESVVQTHDNGRRRPPSELDTPLFVRDIHRPQR